MMSYLASLTDIAGKSACFSIFSSTREYAMETSNATDAIN